MAYLVCPCIVALLGIEFMSCAPSIGRLVFSCALKPRREAVGLVSYRRRFSALLAMSISLHFTKTQKDFSLSLSLSHTVVSRQVASLSSSPGSHSMLIDTPVDSRLQGSTRKMSARQDALDIVQREEENNANHSSGEADRAAASGDYDGANNAANESEEHAENASNLQEANT